jgi:hypothetical protein
MLLGKFILERGNRARTVVQAVQHTTGSNDCDYHKIPRARLAELARERRREFGSDYTRQRVRNVRQYTPVYDLAR